MQFQVENHLTNTGTNLQTNLSAVEIHHSTIGVMSQVTKIIDGNMQCREYLRRLDRRSHKLLAFGIL